MFPHLKQYQIISVAITRTGFKKNKTTNLQTLLNRHLGEQQLEKGSVSKIHIHCTSCKNDNYVDFCIVSFVANMHPSLVM